VFEGATRRKTDPDMVKLAMQLIDRQNGSYDPSDIEDKLRDTAAGHDRRQVEGRGHQG
jgi:non-homologous end joining protein Ku